MRTRSCITCLWLLLAAASLPVQPDPDTRRTKLIDDLLEKLQKGEMSDAAFLQQFHSPFVGLDNMRRFLNDMKDCTYVNRIVFAKPGKDAFNNAIKEVRFYKITRKSNQPDIYMSFSFTEDDRVVFLNME